MHSESFSEIELQSHCSFSKRAIGAAAAGNERIAVTEEGKRRIERRRAMAAISCLSSAYSTA
jgi:hypothetical protein